MPQPVSPQSQSVEAWFSPWQVLVEFVDKIGTGSVLSPSTLVPSCHHHSTKFTHMHSSHTDGTQY